MATIPSVFAPYSTQLQVILDTAKDQYDPVWYSRFFRWATQRVTLTFETVIGRSRIEAAASVVDPGSKAPVRSRPGLEKLQGRVPAITEKFHMDEKIFRDYLLFREARVDDQAKKNQALDLIFDDSKKVVDAAHKRIDYMCLEAVSTGKITLTTTNNPDGLVLPTAIDLLMPAGNKVNASVNWTGSPTTAKPISVDIQGIVNAARARGIRFTRILMTWNSWYAFIATTEVKDMFNAFLGKSGNKLLPTLDGTNEFLRSQQMPVIEIVDQQIGIEKDGVITSVQPFDDNTIAFLPSDQLGVIENAIPIEDFNRIPQVNYGKANRVLVSKWGDNDPFQEWTKGELLAMPSLEAIDGIYLLSRTIAF